MPNALPALPYADWAPTKDTLHLFLQVVGKVRLKAHPKLNHWWHVTFYPAARGLTTGLIPWQGGGFEMRFDLVDHLLRIERDDGEGETLRLAGQSVADFHRGVSEALRRLGIEVTILARPYENRSTTPFALDEAPREYDKAAVARWRQAIAWLAGVFERFRGRFAGKQTPVHLFWHSFDLAVTRFSGRAAPLQGGSASDREAYSHEVASFGFWPGDESFPEAALYAYAYPEPKGLRERPLEPAAASWAEKNGGALAILRWEDLRRSDDPTADALAFFESAYRAAAELADWDVEALTHGKAEG